MTKQLPKERLLCPFYDYKRLLQQGYPTQGRRWLKAGSSRLVYNLLLQSVADKFCVGFHLHLLKHSGAVSADRPNAEKKLFGDLFCRVSCGEHDHDLILSLRESFVKRLGCPRNRVQSNLLRQ